MSPVRECATAGRSVGPDWISGSLVVNRVHTRLAAPLDDVCANIPNRCPPYLHTAPLQSSTDQWRIQATDGGKSQCLWYHGEGRDERIMWSGDRAPCGVNGQSPWWGSGEKAPPPGSWKLWSICMPKRQYCVNIWLHIWFSAGVQQLFAGEKYRILGLYNR